MNVSSSDLSRQAQTVLSFAQGNKFEKAIKRSERLYQAGIQSFQAESREWERVKNSGDEQAILELEKAQREDAPLKVITQLTEALSIESNQLRQELKASLIKTCNFFMQWIFLKTIGKARLMDKTVNGIQELCEEHLKVLPSDEVSSRFTFECCLETAKALKFQVKSVVHEVGPTAIDALEEAWDLNPIRIISRCSTMILSGYNTFPCLWVFFANGLSLAGHLTTECDKNNATLKKIYELYEEHKQTYQVRVSFIGVLTQIVQNCLDDPQNAVKLIKRKKQSKPGLNFFANKGSIRSYVIINRSAWKHRLVAYQALHQLINNKNLDQTIVELCIKILAKRMVLEKQKFLPSILNKIFKSLPEEQKKLWTLKKQKYEKLKEKSETQWNQISNFLNRQNEKIDELFSKGKPRGAQAGGILGYEPLTPLELENLRQEKKENAQMMDEFAESLKIQNENFMLMEVLMSTPG